LPDFKFSDLPKPKAELYVFDDLERCEMPINQSLGYINGFVEHEGRRVVIIANEDEIKEKDEYARRREKLIGKTFELQSEFDAPFDSFIEQIGDPLARSLVESKRGDVSDVYHRSALNNLRALQQSLLDFSRFFGALDERHRRNDQGVTVLLRSFFALSFEFKAGKLRQEDLKGWLNSSMEYRLLEYDRKKHDNKSEPSRCEVAAKRYGEDIDLSGTFLSAKLVEDIFVKGIVNYQEIRSYIDQGPYFLEKDTEPAWRTVWHWTERTEEEFGRAYKQMEEQFLRREFVHLGELLHVFGLRLLLVKMGILKKKPATIVSEGKRYIDDLYSAKTLSPLEPYQTDDTLSWGGYFGLGIAESQSAELLELNTYLEEKRKKAAEDKYPEAASILLREMEDDPSLFLRHVCLTNSPDNLYYRIPILQFIKADDFVASLLRQSADKQRFILGVLKRRYEHGDLNDSLAAEKSWLLSVHDKLLVKAKRMPTMSRYRLTHMTEQYIAPLVKQQKSKEQAAH
jgi:hypothetical protein